MESLKCIKCGTHKGTFHLKRNKETGENEWVCDNCWDKVDLFGSVDFKISSPITSK